MRRPLVILLCLLVSTGFSQSNKNQAKKEKKVPVLFKVNNSSVSTDEFIYLYKKNHQSTPGEFTQEKILEYLDLFVNFKLKVEEARHRGMDTTQAFKKEFNTYRGELRKPYLPESRIVDSLARLTYQRMKEDVRASHILISVSSEATPEDTLAAFNKAMNIKKKAMDGEDFGALAVAHSEDPSARTNRGDLGYFTALQMVHPFETAAYTTPVGRISDPVRTTFGYHLVKVADKRPSRGEVEVSHIMIRLGEGVDETKVKNTIFEVYDQLKGGAPWEELCNQYSEDQNSRNNGGRLRPFGAGAMGPVPEFEQAAFSLQNPGDISDPFKTAFGWHIVRLERKIPVPPLEELLPNLKNRLGRDERLEISKQNWLKKFKTEFGFTENEKVKSKTLALADSTIISGKWSPATGSIERETLFTLGGKGYTLKDFTGYAQSHQRTTSAQDPKNTVGELYDQYIETMLVELLEQKIAAQNPDFKFLMNEYYEGILLFEIMEKEVWNKAVQDSAGLEIFYSRNKSNYQAGERARADIYSSSSPDLVQPLKELIAHNDSIKIETFIREKGLKHESGVYEKSDKAVLSNVTWAKGIYSAETNGIYYLARIHDILPAGPKTFEEAKASVVADYQEELEKIWLSTLRKKYPVKVNEKGKRHILAQLQK